MGHERKVRNPSISLFCDIEVRQTDSPSTYSELRPQGFLLLGIRMLSLSIVNCLIDSYTVFVASVLVTDSVLRSVHDAVFSCLPCPYVIVWTSPVPLVYLLFWHWSMLQCHWFSTHMAA